MDTEAASVGRPTLYTQELADIVCERLANGESMRSVARDDSMPAMSTLFKWLRDIKAFSEQYTRAKEESANALFEDLLDIADNSTNDYMTRQSKSGEDYESVNPEAIARSRLRVDTRKWALSKLMPKKYGERIAVAGEPENPLTMIIKEIAGSTLGPKKNG